MRSRSTSPVTCQLVNLFVIIKIISTNVIVFDVIHDDLDLYSCSARCNFIRCLNSPLCGVLYGEINMPGCVNVVNTQLI